jgi:hypothetical protein
MTILKVATKISEGVLESFKKHSFKYLKSQQEFVRKTDNADQIFRLYYYKEDDGAITIKPELIIQVKEIQKIYKSITEVKGRPYSTLGNYFSHIRDYDGDARNYRRQPTRYWLVENEGDIQHLIKVIPEYLEEDIIPYFESNSSVEKVDKLLNEYPEKMSVHNYIYPSRANIAIIAAKLNKNPRYEELVSVYEARMVDAEENTKNEFYKLKELLAAGRY